MLFSASGNGHSVSMDAKKPIGTDAALTPKELVLAGLCGCTAMDVASLMRKYRQEMKTLVISAEATATDGAHPIVFKTVSLLFAVEGHIEKDKLIEAVTLSQTQYCGVSAMLAKAVDIHYEIHLNGEKVGEGKSNFL